MAVVTSPKTIAVLPQLGSSPDVIIEEIIEENLECCPELVFVSHVIHPCNFYVRKYSQIKDATVLEKKMKQVCNKCLHLDPSDILELGARIFVNSIENRMWCRGIITEIIPTKTKNIRKPCCPTKFSVCEISLIQIFMVDFGNSEVLIITGVGDTHMRPEHVGEQHITLNDFCLLLRKSEPYSEELLKDIPPLAHLCSLKDIVPYNSMENLDFLSLLKTIEEFYKGEDGENLEILCPVQDQACVAKFEDGIWYRAKVIEILENNELLVELFDSRAPGATAISINDQLVKEGLASYEAGISKSNNSHSPEKSLEIPLEQGDSIVTKCFTINFDTNKKTADNTNEHKVPGSKEKKSETRTTSYKPPAIPNTNAFEAVVSCIGDDGTIFVVPKLSEFELIKMMDEIQSNLKCLGLLEPYFWKKGEPCAVRGSDTLWYRGKVMEVVGGTIRVQYLDHGFTEKIPQCHLYPILLYPDTPQFCIPCQLYQTSPVGNVWQPDAIELLQELLSKREVDIHIMVYICLDSVESCTQFNHPGDTDDSGICWESESENLEEALQRFNKNVETFPPLTDFSSDNADALSQYQLNSIQKNDVQIASPDFIWDSVNQRRLMNVTNYDPKSLALMPPPGEKGCAALLLKCTILQVGADGDQEAAVVELQCSQDPGDCPFVISAHFLRADHLQLLLEEVISSGTLSQEVSDLVEMVWAEALGHLEQTLLKPVNSISLNDVSKAEGVLLLVKSALKNGETQEQLQKAMADFYRLIPHKHPASEDVNLRLLAQKEDLCQLVRDMVNVCETNLSKPNPPSLAKYRALRCKIEHVEKNTEEFSRVRKEVLQSNHSANPVDVLQIFRVGRVNEASEFLSKLGNVQSLFHGSPVRNILGILSRGLLLPKVVEDRGVQRTDAGSLGSGIYFSDSLSWIFPSTPHFLYPQTPPMGKSSRITDGDLKANGGFFSQDDEFVVYKTNQVKMKYIVKFLIPGDQIKDFHPHENTELEEHRAAPSNVSKPEDFQLPDIKPLASIKAGLQDASANSVPLDSVHIKGRIIDFVAQVIVFQTYTNQSHVPIEAKYIFPLDDKAAVCGFEAFINGKHIVGEIKEKEEAKQEYREAISQGHGAYLMDQDTPDTVEKICIKEIGTKQSFSLAMSIEMPYKIEFISSDTHELRQKSTDCKAVISTVEGSSLDSSGFSLHIGLHDAYLPRMWVEKHPEKESEACMLVFQPDLAATLPDLREKNEVIICLDCSNSMEGVTFMQAKQVALYALSLVGEEQKVNIMQFGTGYKELFSYPKYIANNKMATEFIMSAAPTLGNTDFWKILRYLSFLYPSEGLRNILLISDGHLQSENLTLQLVKRNIQHTRLFTCAVGNHMSPTYDT
ncbi:Poly [ADP-ribose] polymerase 4 [Cricetulus griseus]|uniref:Poly [ADP-ribose] polymerase n=1 Tax=Cricetulus griseus TaxID=10029 RepID=G3HDG9_CRIGR|nr:Poly [ADP-ribose] polymerase 4 [Cricetulus griseus]